MTTKKKPDTTPPAADLEAEKPAEQERPRIRAVVSKWPQANARLVPAQHASYITLAESRQYGAGRDIIARGLDLFFLSIEPFDAYTEALHEREPALAQKLQQRVGRRTP